MENTPVFGAAVIATGVGVEVRGGYEAAMTQLDTQLRSTGTCPTTLAQLAHELDAAAKLQATNTALEVKIAELREACRQYQVQVDTYRAELVTEREKITALRLENSDLACCVKDVQQRIKRTMPV